MKQNSKQTLVLALLLAASSTHLQTAKAVALRSEIAEEAQAQVQSDSEAASESDSAATEDDDDDKKSDTPKSQGSGGLENLGDEAASTNMFGDGWSPFNSQQQPAAPTTQDAQDDNQDSAVPDQTQQATPDVIENAGAGSNGANQNQNQGPGCGDYSQYPQFPPVQMPNFQPPNFNQMGQNFNNCGPQCNYNGPQQAPVADAISQDPTATPIANSIQDGSGGRRGCSKTRPGYEPWYPKCGRSERRQPECYKPKSCDYYTPKVDYADRYPSDCEYASSSDSSSSCSDEEYVVERRQKWGGKCKQPAAVCPRCGQQNCICGARPQVNCGAPQVCGGQQYGRNNYKAAPINNNVYRGNQNFGCQRPQFGCSSWPQANCRQSQSPAYGQGCGGYNSYPQGGCSRCGGAGCSSCFGGNSWGSPASNYQSWSPSSYGSKGGNSCGCQRPSCNTCSGGFGGYGAQSCSPFSSGYGTGCNSGCNSGCSPFSSTCGTGCNSGCATGCNSGCSTGCATGCNTGCNSNWGGSSYGQGGW